MAIAIALVVLVGVGDEMTGADVAFTLLYLAPIGFATWFVALGAGLALSAVSAFIAAATDVITRPVPLKPTVLGWNFLVQLGVFLALTLALDALKRRLHSEEQQARTDPLTGVANRRSFLEAGEMELERARRHPRPFSVVYLDADDFKTVNDRFGHDVGDLLLVTVARTLRSATRTVDTVARLGGDEFGLLLPETDGPTAEALLGRLRLTLAEALARQGWTVTFSTGVATFVEPTRSVDEMLSAADRLMYEAKRAGKDTVRFETVGRPAAGDAGADHSR
jgi:diguanylate cyclase (GGDEF)-like protein